MPRKASSNAEPKPAGELALIDRIRKRALASKLGKTSLRLGIGDDCAILAPKPGHELLVTTDFSLEGRHFRRSSGKTWHSPASIGHRTLARGLSDLAAMGATPMAAFLSLALPKSVANDDTWLDGFLDGLLTLAQQSSTPLAGGDTSESPTDHILADIVLLGSAPAGRAIRRSGAKSGDQLYVTGSLGGSAAELATLATAAKRSTKTLSSRPKAALFAAVAETGVTGKRSLLAGMQRPASWATATTNPHLFPQPRLAVGQALLKRRLASACIDLSDGLSTDLAHLCTASKVSAEIDAAALPIHALARSLHHALHGGEDYELLFTAPRSIKMPRSISGVPITRIGEIVPANKRRPQVTLVEGQNRSPLLPQGWEHLT